MTSATSLRLWTTTVAIALACATFGGFVGRATVPAALAPATADSATPAPHTLFDSPPSIVVTQDGMVSAHLDHQRLQWVMDELRGQAAAASVAFADPPSPPVAPTSAPVSKAGDEDLRAQLQHVDESHRYDLLVDAQNGGALTPDLLEAIVRTDPSPRVRQLAFEQSLESTEGDAAARKRQLEADSRLPDNAIAEDAARRLAAMQRDELASGDVQLIAIQR